MAQFRVFNIDLISTTTAGARANSDSLDASISNDGTKIAFRSFATNLVSGDTNQFDDLFVKNTVTGRVIRANTASDGTQANASPAEHSSLSGDGSRLGFSTSASNLVLGDTNAVEDVFVKDLASGRTMRVSTAANGTQANDVSTGVSLSADGSKAVFSSRATNLVPGDTNGTFDVFLKDLRTGAISLVSASSTGVHGNADSVAG